MAIRKEDLYKLVDHLDGDEQGMASLYDYAKYLVEQKKARIKEELKKLDVDSAPLSEDERRQLEAARQEKDDLVDFEEVKKKYGL